MLISVLITMFAAIATSAYAVEKPLGYFNYLTQVGVAEVNASGDGCLAVSNATRAWGSGLLS